MLVLSYLAIVAKLYFQKSFQQWNAAQLIPRLQAVIYPSFPTNKPVCVAWPFDLLTLKLFH